MNASGEQAAAQNVQGWGVWGSNAPLAAAGESSLNSEAHDLENAVGILNSGRSDRIN